MNEAFEFLVRHGAAVLFVAVFAEQIGLPLPAAPWLLAAGSLIGTHQMNWFAALLAAAIASLLADLVWFQLGRRYGTRVLNLLCRISLEPDTCVRRTQNVFTKYGMRGVVVAKFIPGVNTLVPPLAGNAGVGMLRFAFYDGLGSLLYVGCYLLLGFIFKNQLEQILAAGASLGSSTFALIAALAAGYIGFKYFQRHRLLHELQIARITVDELHQQVEAGGNPVILDLRSVAEVEQHPAVIRGARHTSMDEVERREQEIPRDRDIILYCSCPNEVTSARLALRLRRKGILRVRPLLGGIDAWRERNYPMDERAVVEAGVSNDVALKAK
jgi:membrane protein DedA with SNARE-associated domain/rhodanese-related sulfurtransferase